MDVLRCKKNWGKRAAKQKRPLFKSIRMTFKEKIYAVVKSAVIETALLLKSGF